MGNKTAFDNLNKINTWSNSGAYAKPLEEYDLGE